jgi:hypothetical protein
MARPSSSVVMTPQGQSHWSQRGDSTLSSTSPAECFRLVAVHRAQRTQADHDRRRKEREEIVLHAAIGHAGLRTSLQRLRPSPLCGRWLSPTCPRTVRRAAQSAARDPDVAPLCHDAGCKAAGRCNHRTHRAVHAPQSLASLKTSHSAGWACCAGKSSHHMTRRGKDGSKSFPTAGPWMISH